LTPYTPLNLIRSPRLRVVAPTAQPVLVMLEPVWPALFTIGVDAVKVPVVCFGTIWS
jgi:hypothetical protein